MDSHLTSLLTFFLDPEATVGHELLSLKCVRNSKRASFTRPTSACGCPHLCEEVGGARVEPGSKRMLSFSTSYPLGFRPHILHTATPVQTPLH